MDFIQLIFVFAVLGLALLTTKLFLMISKKNPLPVKYNSIDGMRGYLALFVFMHHAAIWYFYFQNKVWTDPPSSLFDHFGKTSVSLFFMITAFLFFNKLIENKTNPIDWLKLFVSRILRLYPVYLFTIFIVFIVVGILSSWKLIEPKYDVFTEFFEWATFTLFGNRHLNHCTDMTLINAGVTWSLVYEWLFYFSLPIIGWIFFSVKTSVVTILVTVAFGGLIIWLIPIQLIHIYSFAGGIAASYLVQSEKLKTIFSGKLFSAIAILLIFSTVYFFNSPNEILPITLSAFAFIIFAGGNDLFGILTLSVSKMLGQISYPIYLLHPIILFIVFKFLLGFEYFQIVSNDGYITISCGCTVAIILVCLIVHYFIELPGMKSSEKITKWLKKKFHLNSNP